jgi:hypothetical protein
MANPSEGHAIKRNLYGCPAPGARGSAGYGAGFTLDDRRLSLISAGGMGNNTGSGNGNNNSDNNNGNNNSGNNNGNGNADDNNGNNGSGDNQGNGTGSLNVPKLNLHFLMDPQNSSD